MIKNHEIDALLSGKGHVIDPGGGKIGSIGRFYVDDATSRPGWVTAHTGLFGRRETFIPLKGAMVTGNNIVVDYTKDRVKDAPSIDPDEHLDVDDEQRLFEYYGIAGVAGIWSQETGGDSAGVGVGADTGTEFTRTGTGKDHDRTGLGTDRLRADVSAERGPEGGDRRDGAGRLRLRRYESHPSTRG